MEAVEAIEGEAGRTHGVGPALNIATTLAIQAVAVVVTMALDALGFSQATVVIVFVLAVLLTAVFTTERAYCLGASGLSILCFNFFFVDPRFSFRVWGADVPGTMAVMFVVAMVASYLVQRLRENERASAEALLKAQNEQLRADLLRSVSHDLRTPLTSIMGNADLLLDEQAPLDGGQRRALAQIIYDDAKWLYQVVENLLAVTRMDDERVLQRREPELVSDVVEEALRHTSREGQGCTIDFEPCDELLLARMDAQVMVQVVVNLVNNAIKHAGEHAHIVVRVRREGGMALVSVADDGPGVSDANKPFVFDPFFTSRDAAADGRRGIGLGLSLCQSIVEAHGGTIRVEDAVPHGAIFTFTLPLEDVPGEEGACNG